MLDSAMKLKIVEDRDQTLKVKNDPKIQVWHVLRTFGFMLMSHTGGPTRSELIGTRFHREPKLLLHVMKPFSIQKFLVLRPGIWDGMLAFHRRRAGATLDIWFYGASWARGVDWFLVNVSAWNMKLCAPCELEKPQIPCLHSWLSAFVPRKNPNLHATPYLSM